MGRRKRRMRQSLGFFPPSAGVSVLGTRRRESVWSAASSNLSVVVESMPLLGGRPPFFSSFLVRFHVDREMISSPHSLPVENQDGTSAQMKTALG